MQLSDGLAARINNYNLIRLLAASSVYLSHAFAVVTGDADREPLRTAFGVTWGSIAVDVFFVISGLLVTQSMRRGDSAIAYLRARFLRIWPGLVVSLLVLVTLACALFSTADLRDALHYVIRNSLPYGAMVPAIGGVFVGNPAGPGFNASLWTLPIEVRMYRQIFEIWLISFVFLRHRRLAFDVMIVLSALYYATRYFVLGEHLAVELAPDRLPYMFFLGAAILVLARHVRLGRGWATAAALGAIVVSALCGRSAFFFCYSLLLWYVVLGLAYLPKGKILQFNRLGDYSYGVYIYAWPIQQFAVTYWRDLTVVQNILLTTPVIFGIAVLSWHIVESPALRLKKRWDRPKSKPEVA